MNKSYYESNRKYKPHEVIRDWGLNFNLGNVVKYVSRAGLKTVLPLEDLLKARDYLDYEISAVISELPLNSKG